MEREFAPPLRRKGAQIVRVTTLPGVCAPVSLARASLPFRLESLLSAPDAPSREAAWAEFVAEHSRLLIHVARDLFRQHDGAMDAYTFVLERLEEDGFRRLRGFQDDGRSRFTTWLTV